ncbi:MAG TPA: hypothetical protein VM198_08355 [Longimicrobiales bacterium]|nr:hypothetical protein [Longimicrobiales bacterium]
MKHPHFEHVREHLERVRDGYAFIPDPEQVYLGRQENDNFWELVGLRLQGCPVVVLAALRFERMDRKGVADSRESLAAYLSTQTPGSADARRLTALLPHKDQKIPQFLAGLRAGREFAPVSIDRVRVEVAFDFRADNPSAVKGLRDAASPLRSHYYRTSRGHVLRGESHELKPVEGSEHRFIAVRSPEQLLPQGIIHLPTVFMAHRFIGLQVDVSDEGARLAVRNWVPFLPGVAASEGLIPMGRKKKPA